MTRTGIATCARTASTIANDGVRPAAFERGHQLDTRRAALLGGQRIVERGRDDFEREGTDHRSRTYQASQPKWPVCPMGLPTGAKPLRS